MSVRTISSNTPIAKKEHKCEWCRGIIKIGEKYESSFLEYEEDTYTWKNHISCREIADKLGMFDEDYGVSEYDFKEYIHDEYSSIMSEHHNEEYESECFKRPPFLEQLEFVKKHHKIVSHE